MGTQVAVVYSTIEIILDLPGNPAGKNEEGEPVPFVAPSKLVLPVGTPLRIIIPTFDRELDDPAHVQKDEKMIRLAAPDYQKIKMDAIYEAATAASIAPKGSEQQAADQVISAAVAVATPDQPGDDPPGKTP